MVKPSIGLAGIAGVALALLGPAAQAVTCDIVIDRAGAVVYQDLVPPVDMSEPGAASVEEIVAGMRPYIGVSGGMGSSARPGASGTISGGSTSAPGAQPISVPAGTRSY